MSWDEYEIMKQDKIDADARGDECWSSDRYFDYDTDTCMSWGEYEILQQDKCDAKFPEGVWGDHNCCDRFSMAWDWETEACMTYDEKYALDEERCALYEGVWNSEWGYCEESWIVNLKKE